MINHAHTYSVYNEKVNTIAIEKHSNCVYHNFFTQVEIFNVCNQRMPWFGKIMADISMPQSPHRFFSVSILLALSWYTL